MGWVILFLRQCRRIPKHECVTLTTAGQTPGGVQATFSRRYGLSFLQPISSVKFDTLSTASSRRSCICRTSGCSTCLLIYLDKGTYIFNSRVVCSRRDALSSEQNFSLHRNSRLSRDFVPTAQIGISSEEFWWRRSMTILVGSRYCMNGLGSCSLLHLPGCDRRLPHFIRAYMGTLSPFIQAAD
jgi:hypothetical protein